MQITKGKINKPQRVVIYGPEGIGKTTIASQFPNPIFIDTEGSTEHLDVARTPEPTSWTMLRQQIDYLMTNSMGFQTLVIDTADWAERLCIVEVCAKGDDKGPKSGLEQFGWGKGYTYLAEEFGRLLDQLNNLRDAGFNIVLTAHSSLKKFEQPDEIGSYDRYELKLERKTNPLLKEWADMVLFANYKTLVTDVDGKKKASGGQRVMYTSHRPSWDAKNRHGLADELPFSYESIAHCIPIQSPNQQTPDTGMPGKINADGATQTMASTAQSAVDNTVPADLQPQPEPVQSKAQPAQETAFNTQLYDLMKMDQVTEEELRKAVAAQGYYPEQTPIDNYEENFVTGRLVANWKAVVTFINQKIRGAA